MTNIPIATITEQNINSGIVIPNSNDLSDNVICVQIEPIQLINQVASLEVEVDREQVITGEVIENTPNITYRQLHRTPSIDFNNRYSERANIAYMIYCLILFFCIILVIHNVQISNNSN